MASYTTNLNLVKPTINDPFNVDDANSNMQKIDDAYGKISDATIPISPDVAAALGLTSNAQVKDALEKIATFGVSKKYFTSSGTFTAPYTGKYFVELCGGGGGGASVSNGSSSGSGGAGYAAKTVQLTKGQQVYVTVGSGGGHSGTGGTSSFGSFLSATGGGADTGVSDTSPTIGSGVGGDINMDGGIGLPATSSGSGGIGGACYLGCVTGRRTLVEESSMNILETT